MPNVRRAVVLLSGGLDSAVVLASALRDGFEPHAISFDYHQRHRAELLAAQRVAESLGVPASRRRVVRIALEAIGGSSLTSADLEVPKDRGHEEMASGVPSTYVPARNLVFLSIAAGLAETVGSSDLYIGVNAVDYSGYPDCREEFIRAFEAAANLGTRAGTQDRRAFSVHVPLVRLRKAEIIKLGVELGVDFSLTHSCYDPIERAGATLACGRCDSCRLRSQGFADAGVADPTRYA